MEIVRMLYFVGASGYLGAAVADTPEWISRFGTVGIVASVTGVICNFYLLA